MAAEKGLAFLLKKALLAGTTVTFTNASNICNFTAHGMSAGDVIIFTGGVLPVALVASQIYYAGTILANSFTMHNNRVDAVGASNVIALAGDGSGTITGRIMTTVAGMRTTAFTINGEEVNITTKDSTSQWRELLAGSGEVNISISAAGVYQDDAGLAAMRVLAVNRTLETYMLDFESFDTYWGLFQTLSVEQAGEYKGEVTYTITLESSGVASFINNV